ncbi:MAG: glyoxylate reductase [Lentisphaeria bacterium]|nr:glyoxylate reductase [Lentisphaeria bacterium]
MKKKLLSLCPIADSDAKNAMSACYDITEMTSCTEEELFEKVADYQALIVPYSANMLVSERVIDKGTSLEIIASSYGGTRQNIADIYAIRKGLKLIHTGESRERPMAEYTLGLVLSSLLRIHNYHHDMCSGEWPRFKYPRTRILCNRAVAVVGYGRIGKAIAKLFSCFTDKISVVSKHLTCEDAASEGVKKVTLEEAFRDSEIIILAGGNTPSTYHMVGEKEFALMKKDALFVNIARGKMVDEEAMIRASQEKEIFLALDVFDTEPLPEDSPLRNRENILVTPHRANNSIEFEERWQCLAKDMIALAEGKTPDSVLTEERASAMSES